MSIPICSQSHNHKSQMNETTSTLISHHHRDHHQHQHHHCHCLATITLINYCNSTTTVGLQFCKFHRVPSSSLHSSLPKSHRLSRPLNLTPTLIYFIPPPSPPSFRPSFLFRVTEREYNTHPAISLRHLVQASPSWISNWCAFSSTRKKHPCPPCFPTERQSPQGPRGKRRRNFPSVGIRHTTPLPSSPDLT